MAGAAKRNVEIVTQPSRQADVPAAPELAHVPAEVREIVALCGDGGTPTEAQVERLFRARGADFSYVCQQANALRAQVNGDTVSYAVNRNINYTNICYFKCQFCAFSKGKLAENLRGRPYDLSEEEIARHHGDEGGPLLGPTSPRSSLPTHPSG